MLRENLYEVTFRAIKLTNSVVWFDDAVGTSNLWRLHQHVGLYFCSWFCPWQYVTCTGTIWKSATNGVELNPGTLRANAINVADDVSVITGGLDRTVDFDPEHGMKSRLIIVQRRVIIRMITSKSVGVIFLCTGVFVHV